MVEPARAVAVRRRLDRAPVLSFDEPTGTWEVLVATGAPSIAENELGFQL
jgi:hypothetical protein